MPPGAVSLTGFRITGFGELSKNNSGSGFPQAFHEGFVCVFQSSGKLEKAEILEMTVQYLRALHSADFPRGREKGRYNA